MSRQQDGLPHRWESRCGGLLGFIASWHVWLCLGQLGLCCSAVFPSLLLHKAELGLEMEGRTPSGSRTSSPQASLANLGAPGQQDGTQWPAAGHLHLCQDAGLEVSWFQPSR